jgi:DNA mismatch repair protein MutL
VSAGAGTSRGIRRLDPIVVDQIAAGEVVERPASVVKELVENALDAGATRVEVLLEEGGTRRIEVRDDGVGIPAEELGLALASHATSKLRAPGDLEAIASLGFRGEALASIAAVSRLELSSRPRDGGEGAALRVDFGRMGEVRAAAAADGTRVVVEDLFAELPARRKFLKRPSTEAAHASAWVERLLLAHLGTAFRLVHDGRVLLDVGAEDDLAARCAAVFGERVSSAMVEVERDGTGMRMQARVGPPESARRDARAVHLFLNGLWVRDPRLLRAVREGVREFVPIGHYPTLYLALQVSPDRVDVNVHPQKTEVRFRDERMVFGSVVNLLRGGLSKTPWATRSAGGIGGDPRGWQSGSAAGGSGVLPLPSDMPAPGAAAGPAGSGGALPGFASPSAGAGQVGEGRLPLQPDAEHPGEQQVISVANTFLVRTVPGGLEILDQHALHERVNLEELRRELRQGQVVMQPLLVPALVEVSREELVLLEERADLLRTLGVEVEAFGETTLAIRAVPARLRRLQPEGLVQDLLEVAGEHRAATPDALQEEMLHSMACRGAVMAGDRLGREQLEGLLRRGADLPQDRTCAHGRPVRVLLSVEDLERAFYRR